jgi:hypothetical protein
MPLVLRYSRVYIAYLSSPIPVLEAQTLASMPLINSSMGTHDRVSRLHAA